MTVLHICCNLAGSTVFPQLFEALDAQGMGSEGIPLCLNAVQAGKVMAGIYRNWDAAA